jgi:hypothetical protein
MTSEKLILQFCNPQHHKTTLYHRRGIFRLGEYTAWGEYLAFLVDYSNVPHNAYPHILHCGGLERLKYSALQLVGKLINLLLSVSTVCLALSLVLRATKEKTNNTVQISVKSCIYGWKIDFKIDFYSSDLWPLKDKPLKIIHSRFPNSFFRGTFSSQL